MFDVPSVLSCFTEICQRRPVLTHASPPVLTFKPLPMTTLLMSPSLDLGVEWDESRRDTDGYILVFSEVITKYSSLCI